MMPHAEQLGIPEWLDLRALVGYACVSERTIREWIHRHHDPLPAVQVEKKLLVRRTQFDRWLEAHRYRAADQVEISQVVDQVLLGLKGKN
jgi:excisionase family DNA binding protein